MQAFASGASLPLVFCYQERLFRDFCQCTQNSLNKRSLDNRARIVFPQIVVPSPTHPPTHTIGIWVGHPLLEYQNVICSIDMAPCVPVQRSTMYGYGQLHTCCSLRCKTVSRNGIYFCELGRCTANQRTCFGLLLETSEVNTSTRCHSGL